MAISKEQWDEVNEKLTYSAYNALVFKYKSHEIIMIKIIKSATQSYMQIFIDGKQDWECNKPSKENFNPLYKLFWFHVNHKKVSSARIKSIEKEVGKRNLKKLKPDIYTERHDFYWPTFKSAKTLINQFKKVEDLEFIGEISLPEFSERIKHD